MWEVPLLFYIRQGVTDKEAKTAEKWMKEYYPKVTEYKCIDYMEGDLNKDGRTDIAFVIDGTFENIDESNDDMFVNTRYLFILLKQKNGSWQEASKIACMGEHDGGTRGDPYRGVFLGEGYLITKEGWGSGSGGEITCIYLYQEGKLELAKDVWVSDYNYVDSYDVKVTDDKDDTWSRFIIATDDRRLIRIDLADSEHPFHKAFPELTLNICKERPDTNITSAEALDRFRDEMGVNAEREKLPYALWQKESYELLGGIELPDYYYTVQGTERKADEKKSDESSKETWAGDYIYYDSLCSYEGQLYHIIYYVKKEEWKYYLLNDDTGEIHFEGSKKEYKAVRASGVIKKEMQNSKDFWGTKKYKTVRFPG